MKIQQLSPQLANLIAAGEVVERPASVVKELVENAVDAGAKSVTVEIQNGGMGLIRVTDDGAGIPKEEAETAFLRHATSKVQTAVDLEAIATLGFRGEALAAIASVSRVELLTRTAEETLGLSLSLDGGEIRAKEETGCPLGSTFLVRNLFFNTPARLKFMKRDASEGAAVFGLLQKLALAHPDVSFTFLRDGKRELQTPGDGALQSVLYSVLGRDLALGFQEVGARWEGISVTGFVSLPVCCRPSRNMQHFIVGGRPIKAPMLTAALEEAYRNQKMVGKFPACVLHLDMNPASVDVNVHPAKTEVKFQNERAVFGAVCDAVRSALGGKPMDNGLLTVDKYAIAASLRPMETPLAESSSIGSLRDSMGVLTPLAAVLFDTPMPSIAPKPAREPQGEPQTIREREPIAERKEEVKTERKEEPETEHKTEEREIVNCPLSAVHCQDWRFAGELFRTYIVLEVGSDILLIDKHAAHERINFDRMKAEDYRPMMQDLLAPRVLRLPPEETDALSLRLPLLRDFGFVLEEFGGGSLLLRAVPGDLTEAAAEAALGELAAGLLTGTELSPEAARDHVLATMACKAAIKGGYTTDEEELKLLAEAVLSGAVRTCPHGRPVSVTLTKRELERRFGRG